MKKVICISLAALILLAVGIGWRLRAQSGPVQMGGTDLVLYQRDWARIKLIEIQTKPMMDEFNGLTSKWCSQAKVSLDRCTINTDTGMVSQISTGK